MDAERIEEIGDSERYSELHAAEHKREAERRGEVIDAALADLRQAARKYAIRMVQQGATDRARAPDRWADDLVAALEESATEALSVESYADWKASREARGLQ
jgi:crotonobetainyl-CoA:carnitine CoA-transferase CaiB-like acyl-CoA transferase